MNEILIKYFSARMFSTLDMNQRKRSNNNTLAHRLEISKAVDELEVCLPLAITQSPASIPELLNHRDEDLSRAI
jgi:hypothetical protein